MPKLCKKIALLIAKDLNIDTAIYDPVRLFRMNNTINGKSGLYKIALTEAELMNKTIDDIKVLARAKRDISFDTKEVNVGLLKELASTIKESRIKSETKKSEGRINKLTLHGTKLCYWRMLQGVDQGIRDQCAIRIAADYAKKGMPAEIAYKYMQAWNSICRPPLEDDEIKAKVASAYGSQVYDYGCNDEILSQFCHEDCFLFDNSEAKEETIKVYQLSELSEHYKEYITNMGKRKILYPCLPKITSAIKGHRPGEVTTVLARPGVGKSLLGQSLIHYVSNIQKVASIMFSMEMPKELVFERSISMEFELNTEEVEKAYAKNQIEDIENHISTLNNMYFVDKCNLSLSEMQKTVEGIGNIGFVVMDYMSLVKGIGKDDYERTSYVARRLKDFAKETETAVLMISQVSRKGGDGTEPVNLEDGRNSGAIEEGADFVLGMHRNLKNLKEVVCQLLKNRRGETGVSENMQLLGSSVKFVSTEDWGLEDEQ